VGHGPASSPLERRARQTRTSGGACASFVCVAVPHKGPSTEIYCLNSKAKPCVSRRVKLDAVPLRCYGRHR
jgi:hypothetical protein